MQRQFAGFPLLRLIDTRQHTALIAGALAAGALAAGLAVAAKAVPLWAGAIGVLALVFVAAVPKWREDRRRYGTTAMVISVLLAAQGFHWVEHISQFVQYHVLRWPFWQASGLISPANSEWVHFVWNWVVLATVIYLMRSGVRGVWMWLLLAWAGAHTFEHTYLMVRYVQTLAELRALGVSDVAAQGLPGILGRDGWLATADATQSTFLCRLPGLTTAPRLDVHFWWNAGETVLLVPAANAYMGRIASTPAEGRL